MEIASDAGVDDVGVVKFDGEGEGGCANTVPATLITTSGIHVQTPMDNPRRSFINILFDSNMARFPKSPILLLPYSAASVF
ncbi:hypothetical protein [Novipirellula maiorica]|uniref:hypothetical protein n=1 Tax=Novipirellula maiorica TaxID=1265734 RepID=UPI00068D9D14|nr:hypothetical protein [Rhodopirellula maiorica]